MSEPGYEPGYGYTQKSRNSSKKSTKTKTEQNINRCNSIHFNNPSTVLLCTNCLLYSASDQYDEELALSFFFKVRLRHILQASNFEHPPYPASLLQENSHLHRSASTQSFHSLTDSFKTLPHLKLQCLIWEFMAIRKEDIVSSRKARDHLFSTFKPDCTKYRDLYLARCYFLFKVVRKLEP